MARNRGVRAATGVGVLDRVESEPVFQGAGAANGKNCGARAAGVLRGASFGESAGEWGGGGEVKKNG